MDIFWYYTIYPPQTLPTPWTFQSPSVGEVWIFSGTTQYTLLRPSPPLGHSNPPLWGRYGYFLVLHNIPSSDPPHPLDIPIPLCGGGMDIFWYYTIYPPQTLPTPWTFQSPSVGEVWIFSGTTQYTLLRPSPPLGHSNPPLWGRYGYHTTVQTDFC